MVSSSGDGSYFLYKGTAYGKGTKVLLAEKTKPMISFPLGSEQNIEEIKNKPHIFNNGFADGRYNFIWNECEGNKWDYKYHTRSQVFINDPDEEIAKIIEPVYIKIVPWQEKSINNMISGELHSDVFGGCLIYIVIMLVGAIFNARWMIWIFATIIFIIWLLNQFKS